MQKIYYHLIINKKKVYRLMQGTDQFTERCKKRITKFIKGVVWNEKNDVRNTYSCYAA